MKHDLIKTDNYLLVVDESEIKGWYYDAYIDKVKHSGGAEYGESIITRNIIAHLPLNGSPILKGVDLLPPLEEEDVEKLALDIFPRHEDWRLNSDNADKRPIWANGYNQAKEKYKYTEEDLRKVVEMARDIHDYGHYGYYWSEDEIIQYLSQPKMPIGFECVTIDKIALDGHTIMGTEPKTTTTPEGHIQWIGTYLYADNT